MSDIGLKYRIKHLLVATFVVALFAMGLTNPSETMEAAFKLGLYFVVAVWLPER